MAKKSDRTRRRRVSATEASRSFSRLLDEVESGGRFLVHRHGRDVCVLESPAADARTASECLDILRSRARVELDDLFGRDLMEVVSGEPVEERPKWGS